jgi:uncharacterized protein (UPF0332 family)
MKKRDLDGLKRGVWLEQTFGCTIGELERRVVTDRFALAKQCLAMAKRALRAKPGAYRLAVGRSYYAMYHAVRSVAFVAYGGDDFEAHDKFPGHLPTDFTDRALWENRLKSARLDRNRADYEPYPKRDASFQTAALDTFRAAEDLVQECRSYLRSKGCRV